MLKMRIRHFVPSRHVTKSKPYFGYGSGVCVGAALALAYLFLTIRLISGLVYSLQEPPPVDVQPVFADESPPSMETLALPDPEAYGEAESLSALLQDYLGDDLKSFDLSKDGLLTINLRAFREAVALTQEQAEMVHGSYLDEGARREAYARMGSVIYLVYHHPAGSEVRHVRIQLAVPGTAPDGKLVTVYDVAQGNLPMDTAERIIWDRITIDEFIRLIRMANS